MTETDTEFEQALREQTQVKLIPNAEFEDGQFTFADYFDAEAFKESYTGPVKEEGEWPNWAFEPYEMYFAGVPEIETNQEYTDMYWFEVSITLPDDPERQRLLAALVTDAIVQRKER